MMGIIIEKGIKKNGCYICYFLVEKLRKKEGEKGIWEGFGYCLFRESV